MATLAGAVLLGSAPGASAAGGGSLDRAVVSAAGHGARHARGAHFRVSGVSRRGSWAFGDVVMIPRGRNEGGGVPSKFLARDTRHGWKVTLQGTSAFLRYLRAAPRSLVPSLIRKLILAGQSSPVKLGGSGPAAEPQFMLPWAVGQTWHMWFGPHNTNNDAGPHPYTSIDFSGGDGIVRAAAAGVVYRPCRNLVVVDHGGGWETGYYHLPRIFVRPGQPVSTGTPLGTIGTGTGCGGVAHGAHVHFSIYHFRTSGVYNVFRVPSDDVNGDVIGGWVIHDGPRSGLGYMQRLGDGLIVSPTDSGGSGAIFNSGISGSGGAPTAGAPPYRTLANVVVHSAPSTSSSTVGSLPNGTPVQVVCQAKGDSVNGSPIWDQINPGKYIPDWYVSTPEVGQFSPGIPQCPPPPSGGGGGTSPPSGTGTTSATAGLPPLGGGAYDTSFEHQMPWATLNGNTNQLISCGSGAPYDGNCYLNVNTSTGTGSFYEDIHTGLPTNECYTLAAWMRSSPGNGSYSGVLALWAINGVADRSSSVGFTTTSNWQRFLVTLRVPAPTNGTPWHTLRGQVYLHSTSNTLNWDLTQWYGPYSC